jgi:Tfp pilus assembly protein PilO
MPRNSDRNFSKSDAERRGSRFWLRAAAVLLAVANGVALFLYLAPPGGSRRQLSDQSLAVRNQVLQARARAGKLRNVAAKVTVGNSESGDFETKYFLRKRLAYGAVITEIQRMAKAAGLQERDAVYTEEPIEGTADLDLLNCSANYEGNYDNLMRFLFEVDHSPMLLMLENLQAAPQQQKGSQINTSIRFQAIMQEETPPAIQQSTGGSQ